MAFFEKLSKLFRRAPAPAGVTGSSTGAPALAPTAIPASTAGPTAARADSSNPSLISMRDQFLQELRSIPTRPSAIDLARQDFLKELKRLSGPDKDGRSS